MQNSTSHGGELTEAELARQQQDEALLADPAVATNFARHVAALKELLTGRANCKTGFPGPTVVACLAQEWSAFRPLLGLISLTDRDHVLLRFDRQNPLGQPTAIDVVRHVGDQLAIDMGCGLWAPLENGRAVLTSRDSGAPRYFKFDPARPLIACDGLPAIAIEPGCLRAGLRFGKLAQSPKVIRAAEKTAVRAKFTGIGPGEMSVDLQRAVA